MNGITTVGTGAQPYGRTHGRLSNIESQAYNRLMTVLTDRREREREDYDDDNNNNEIPTFKKWG